MGDTARVAEDGAARTEANVAAAGRPAEPGSEGFRHPAYRISCEDAWDHILGHELRILPGGFLHVRVLTLYKHPTVTEARGGVAISFGENISYVTIDNLNRAYRLFIEPAWYAVEMIYAPVEHLLTPPTMIDIFTLDEQVAGRADENSRA